MGYTKQGWPTHKEKHHIRGAFLADCEIESLRKQVQNCFGFYLYAVSDGENFHNLSITAKIGINKYAEIRAFVNGFIAGIRS